MSLEQQHEPDSLTFSGIFIFFLNTSDFLDEKYLPERKIVWGRIKIQFLAVLPLERLIIREAIVVSLQQILWKLQHKNTLNSLVHSCDCRVISEIQINQKLARQQGDLTNSLGRYKITG